MHLVVYMKKTGIGADRAFGFHSGAMAGQGAPTNGRTRQGANRMKYVIAVIKPFKLGEVRQALHCKEMHP